MKKRNKTQESFGDEVLREKLRQIGSWEKQAPETLRKEVFSSLDVLQLLADVTGLFTVQFAQAKLEMLDTISSPENGEEEE